METARVSSQERAEDEHPTPRDGAVVVGIDGSASARRALDVAAELAMGLDHDLVVVHALGLYDHISSWQTPVEEYEIEAFELLRDVWCSSLDELDRLEWSSQLVRGEAVHTLLSIADEVEASVLVVGSHGAGGSLEPLLGNTSYQVLLNSHRPVLVVPEPEPGPDA